ncbi:MAG: peptidylprolyl isomerase [Deltaproteobacteria bacterium]|nr:peptidylprolyl isomerase [Deltaproteobacteria bacterium]
MTRWANRIAAAMAMAMAACGAKPARVAAPTVAPERLAIALAEADRDAGVERLVGFATRGDALTRKAAVRGLGRVGGHAATAALRQALATDDPAIITAAAAALGLAAATDGVIADDQPGVAEDLVAALGKRGVDRAVIVEALGRAGDDRARGALIEAVGDRDPQVAAAAGVALGRFGRRGMALGGPERAALIAATSHVDPAVRYGATYALARAIAVPPTDGATSVPDRGTISALRARLADTDAEVRAIAAAGLGRQDGVAATADALIDRLGDGDWRVRVEAVRALAGDHGTDGGRDAIAVHAVRTWTALRAHKAPPPGAHELLEALRLLAGHAERPAVGEALAAIAAPSTGADLAGSWAECLALDALARPRPEPGPMAPVAAFDRLATCGPALLPWQRQALIAGAIAEGAGGEPVARYARLATMLVETDPRAVAAALGAIPHVVAPLDADARAAATVAIAQRLAHPEASVVESAAEAAAAVLADAAIPADAKPALGAALVARAATTEPNPEVKGELLGAIATAKLADGLPACTTAASDANPAVGAAGRACITALGGTPPAIEAHAPPHPPVDPATVVGHAFRWTVETTRGRIVIALDSEVAPWHVAALVALTRAQFYDGLLWHRVVPDFVAQGGDPTGTGAGGPGYTLPAEVGSRLDLPGYVTGAVGIADAGKDTGGSQWFVMHGPAPHLDGRYTQVGTVVEGQDVIDALQVGDTITRATISE